MDIGAWIKEHPWEAGGIGVVVLVILYYWFFSGSSSSGSSDLSSYYNAEAAQAAAGAQQQALQSQLAAASQYYTTQGQVATTTSANDLAAQQAIATAQVQEAQAQASAAEVTSRQNALVGVTQANDALAAVQSQTTPTVLASQDFLAFLSAFSGANYMTGTGFAAGGAQGTSTTNLASGIATTGGGIYGQALAVGPGANALFPSVVNPGNFGAPGSAAPQPNPGSNAPGWLISAFPGLFQGSPLPIAQPGQAGGAGISINPFATPGPAASSPATMVLANTVSGGG